MTDGDGIPRMDTSDVQYSRKGGLANPDTHGYPLQTTYQGIYGSSSRFVYQTPAYSIA